MTTSKKLRILAMVVIAGLASVATSAWAMPDTPAKLAGFIWQDETVYRPDSPSNDLDRGWSSGGICDGKFCRQ
jgi:uncharacterized protein Usg